MAATLAVQLLSCLDFTRGYNIPHDGRADMTQMK